MLSVVSIIGRMRLIARLFPAALLLSLALSTASLKLGATEDNRLPENIVPSHYSLDLRVDPQNTHYIGYVEIKITATDADDGIIRLHAAVNDITIETVLLDYSVACELTASDIITGIRTLACPRGSLNGEHKLTIEFRGKFADDMDGFYKSTYEEDGVNHVLVSTQFESTSARRAFPCFDEPSFKATYDIFITHPSEYSVLGNTAVKKEYSIGNDQIQTEFETTPIMSTYLVAFAVSTFVPNGEDNESDFFFKVYARPEAKEFTNVASTYGPTLINLLSHWTNINYADLGNHQVYLVAIPDFAAGAMENWGLITFREVDLLDEGEKTSHSAKQRIITVVAHELSHMWFGDYVTLDWWSDTWLNEGFATYFEFHIPDEIPNENLQTSSQFVVDVLQSVLQVDALPSSNPLTGDLSRFDDISYDKGGSIVRMMRYILGEDVFKAGLNFYLRTYHYHNTNPHELLDSLQSATPTITDFANIMTNWIYKPGFPLITVTLNEDGTSVNLSQERFLAVENSTAEATEWYVPISYTTSDEKNFEVEIKTWVQPGSTVNVTIKEDSWIILNIQETGFYRVNYDDKLWDRLIAALNNNTERAAIHALNRAQLIDDVFNIARVGKIDYEKAFRLLEFLNSETEYYPWVSALNAISYLSGKLGDNDAETLLQNRTLRLLNSAFSDITDLGTAHVDMLKTVKIWDWACKLGHGDCINYAKTNFEAYKTSNSLPDYNKRGIVFCYGLRNSDNPNGDYEFLFDVFKKSKSSVEQNVIISSLGCLSDPDVLLKYISETIATNSSIRKQDGYYVLRSVYSTSDIGVEVALTFLEQNTARIIDTYGRSSTLTNLITGLAGRVKTDEQINRLTRVIINNGGIDRIGSVGQLAIDTMASNKAWTEKYGPTIKDVLERTEPSSSNILKPRYIFSTFLSLSAIYLLHY